MGGLVNGRRGGRSPPLMIGALIACILVLGFNYWVSSSRNLELQTKLYELESQVRRGAAERGAVEVKKNEFQEEVQRQKEQISRIENLYKRQLEGAQNTCTQERGPLQLNVSTSTKTIQDLKVQLNQLNDELGKVQKQLQSCHGDLDTLNKKLTYDMTQCNTQILAQREECAEKLAAVKQEAQKKTTKPKPAVSSQVNVVPTGKASTSRKVGVVDKEEPGRVGLDDTKTTPVLGHSPELPPLDAMAGGPDAPELLTNEILEDTGLETPDLTPVKELSKPESSPSLEGKQHLDSPADGAVEPGEEPTGHILKKNQVKDDKVEVLDTHGGVQAEGAEDILIGQDKGEDAPIGQKVDNPEDYDADEQIVGGVDPEKRNALAETIDKEMEDEEADYNGDDENEGEFEADKMAELAQI
ncbi:Golgi membrane protein 1 [Hypomesus transpacificus]|uniref:Golgi membrane protein 1 n=1 Tax=Hypomesus transpacificus TaxID=137520 RepID=UPI001F07B594|nr:Golgi membrane protein 1 [Hypomesus transpacificus]